MSRTLICYTMTYIINGVVMVCRICPYITTCNPLLGGFGN